MGLGGVLTTALGVAGAAPCVVVAGLLVAEAAVLVVEVVPVLVDLLVAGVVALLAAGVTVLPAAGVVDLLVAGVTDLLAAGTVGLLGAGGRVAAGLDVVCWAWLGSASAKQLPKAASRTKEKNGISQKTRK